MNIKQAEPQQLEQLTSFFDSSSVATDSQFVRKLSYCLARGTCYVSDSSEIDGAILIDRDCLGFDRVVAVSAGTSEQYQTLLQAALENCLSSMLFLETPPPDSPLFDAAERCGFAPSGELTLPGAHSQSIQLLVAQQGS